MRMQPKMFDELLAIVSPRITKKHTWYREPLEPGLKLAMTLRHLASWSKYSAMKYGWRVPHNTQSFIVREVCQAIIDEYMAKVMTCPTTPEDGVPYLTSSSRSGTSPIMWCTRLVPNTSTTRASTLLYSWAL